MRIENEFTVAAPADRLWAHLLDVERIAPCMPGAELTEAVDETTWKGKVHIKLGPIAMAFAGTVTMEERDDEARRVRLRAKGTEQRGKGAANATITSWLEATDDADRTRVKMEADITLTGAAAQLSRGLLPEVSKKLTQEFADCLQASMGVDVGAPAPVAPAGEAASPPGATPPTALPSGAPAAAAAPVGGIRLGLTAIWGIVVRWVRALFGGGKRA